MNRFRLLLPILFFTAWLPAQFTVTGQLADPDGNPQEFANAVLFRQADTSFVTGATTTTDGTFSLKTDREGAYFVRASALGYGDVNSQSFKLDAGNSSVVLGTLSVGSAGVDLETVTVTTTKPLFERRIDRTVVNLEGRPTVAGSSVLEVVERLPGVVVSRQGGSINILGKDGVNVMINGRRQYLSAAYLEGMPADNLESIEIITTPPADMDADGNAGFLNIRVKNLPGEGLKGNYTLGAGYGNGETANGSLNLDYRRGKVAINTTASVLHSGQGEFSDLSRTTAETQTGLTYDRDPSVQTVNARLGLDYQASERTILGVAVSGYLRNWNMDAENRIRYAPDTNIVGTVNEKNVWRNVQTNFNIAHTFNNGSSLSADFDYLYFKNDNPTTFDFNYSLGDRRIPESDFTLLSDKTTPFGISVGKLDYTLPLSEGKSLAVGTKAVISNFDNDVLVTRNGISLDGFTGLSELTEDIYAAYAQLDYPVSEKLAFKAGLRYEYSDTKLDTEDQAGLVDRQFGRLFPSIYARFGKLNLSYGRRVNRPSFSAMAPFLNFLDPRTNFGGNPRLQPSISDNFEASIRLGTINFSAQYAVEDSTLVNFQNRFDEVTNTQIIIPDNLRSRRTASFSVGSPLPLGEAWTARLFGTLLWQETETVIDDGRLLVENQTNVRLNGSIGYDFGSDWSGEVSGFYQGKTLNGNVRILPMGILNVGVTKRLPNGARLSMNLTDALETLEARTETNVPSQDFFVERTFDFSNRTLRLSYSANIGGGDVRAARKRAGVEEAGRVL